MDHGDASPGSDGPGGMRELSSFQQRRLELADMLRAVLPIAHAYADERRQDEIRAQLARLAAGRFQLAVVGQFSRGKTTLMNALLGGAYMPMGALPMTSVVTTVRYGTRPRALVRSRAAGLPLEVPVSDVARFVAQASTERTRMQVASVEVEIPAELLRLGFEFVDTPGVGSVIAANTATTLRYLPQADAVVFVSGFDSALTEAEAEFLTQAAASVGKLFLVLNKRDLVTDAGAADVTGYVQRWTAQNLGPGSPQVFGLSALQALQAVLETDARYLADSGIEPLRSALIQFLTTEKGTTSLRAVAAATATLIDRQQRDLSAWRSVHEAGLDQDSVTADFDARMSDLHAAMAIVLDRIASQVAGTLPSLLAGRVPGWLADLQQQLAAGTQARAGNDDGMVAAMAGAVDRAGREVAGWWLEQQAAEVREALIAATAGDIGALLDLARSPRDLGATTVGLQAVAALPAGWSAEEVPELLVRQVEWVVPEQPARHRRRRGRESADEAEAVLAAEARTAAARSFTDRAQAALQDGAERWIDRLREDATQRVEAEAAQFRRYLLTAPREEDLTVLADLAGRLVSYRESLTDLTVGDEDGRDEKSASRARIPVSYGELCGVCEAMESAVTEYLMHRQFLLATSEDEQAKHADAGGFCPLHTWQYAHLASPVGISAGNARLAGMLAEALAAMTSGGAATEQLAAAAGQLIAATQCPACALLADTERHAAAELAAAAQPAAPPRLCLRHLAVVLDARPSREASLAMIDSLAATLLRAAEDMRSYALKREALRRSLITADEADAYTDVLRLLASLPSLATAG